MKAWQITNYGSPEVLKLVEIPEPKNQTGWVKIRVKAFGLNRSELYTRQGHSGDAVTLPRVLGIECVGEVIDGGGTDLKVGQKVAAAMGDMGRLFDGGYAEMTLIPRSNVFPINTDLAWEIFGALPETYLTAWGAIHESIQLQAGASLLIRGGTSAAGQACISIAKDMGCTVLATTRSDKKAEKLHSAGVDHVIIDKGESLVSDINQAVPGGVDGVVEFIGIEASIKDSLLCCAPQGTVCMVGFLGDTWDYKFFPWMPSSVKLTIYNSETIHSSHQSQVLQTIVNKTAAGIYQPNIHQVFKFEDLPEAHEMMEQNRAAGKLVISV